METGPIVRRDALAKGYSDGELRRMAARQGWTRLRPGYYLPQELERTLDREERHRSLVDATVRQLSAPAAVSHQSAAAVHRLPLWGLSLDRVHLTRLRPSGGHRGKHVHVHCAPFRDLDVTQVGSLLVCSPERAVVDIARSCGLQSAVALGDAAARQFPMTRESLCDALQYAKGRPGFRAALRAIDLLDGRSESVGESRSRVVLAQLGFPTPDLQTAIIDENGRFVARADFCFEQLGVIVEFDGKTKYHECLRPGETPGEAVYREKLREDRLRDLGWEVVRLTWADLDNPTELAARIRRAFDRAAHRPRPLGSTVRMASWT